MQLAAMFQRTLLRGVGSMCVFSACLTTVREVSKLSDSQQNWGALDQCCHGTLARQSQQGIYLTAYLVSCFPNGNMHSVAQIPFLACRHRFSQSEPGRRSERGSGHHVSNKFPAEPDAASPQNSPEEGNKEAPATQKVKWLRVQSWGRGSGRWYGLITRRNLKREANQIQGSSPDSDALAGRL